MTSDRIRSLVKKLAPFILGGAVVGGAGSFALHRYLGETCCAPGAACCHPGAACCHGHAASGGVAQR